MFLPMLMVAEYVCLFVCLFVWCFIRMDLCVIYKPFSVRQPLYTCTHIVPIFIQHMYSHFPHQSLGPTMNVYQKWLSLLRIRHSMSRVHICALSSMELFAIEGVAFNQSFRLLTFDAVVLTCVQVYIYELYKAIILCG